jgi:hypothetical protein
MKGAKALTTLGLLLLLAAPGLNAICSNATAAGTYAFTSTGTLILPTGAAPVAAVGLITFQLNGNTTGSQDRSVGGAFAHETITGTLTVNRDCTSSLVANVYDTSGNLVRISTISAVFVNNAKLIRGVFESVTLPDGTALPAILTVDANRM